jgi:hypothetical protein
MRTIKIICVLVSISIHFIQAQNDITLSARAANFNYRLQQLGGQMRSGDMISGFGSGSAPEVVGDTYWDKHWGQSSLLMYKSSSIIEGYLIRYDIHKDEFEFNLSTGIKVIRGSLVKDLIWIDSLKGHQRFLVNAQDFTSEGTRISGFLELLVEGKYSLYKKVNIEILKPNFNPALNVGSKDVRIIKKESYYYNSGANELVQIKSKKTFHPLIEKGVPVETYLRKDRLDIKKEADLIKLFSSIN